MIDWYLLLFFAFTLAILYIDNIGNHRSVYEYISPSRQIGLSEGTYSIIIQFMTGSTFLFPLILMEKYKLSSLFIFGVSALVVYLLLVKLSTNNDIKNTTIYPYSQSNHSSSQDTKPYFLIIFAISNLGSIFIQTSIVAFLLNDIFQQSLFLSLGVFLSFCFIYFGLGGNYGNQKIGSKLLFMIFFVLVFTTLTLYLRTGIGTVFVKYEDKFDTLFNGNVIEIFFCVLTFLFVTIGQTCTNFYFWQLIYSVKSTHRLSALRFSMFSWVSILLAFAVLTLFLLVQNEGRYISQLPSTISQTNIFLLPIMTLIVITILTIGVGNTLYSIISIFLFVRNKQVGNNSTYQLLRHAYLFGIFICCLIGVATFYFYGYVESWLPFFVSFFSAAGFPFVLTYFTGHFYPKHSFYTVLVMIFISIVLAATITNIWFIAPLSILLTLITHSFLSVFKII